MFDSGTTLIETVERPSTRRRVRAETTHGVPTTVVRHIAVREAEHESSSCNTVGMAATQSRRVECSEFVALITLG